MTSGRFRLMKGLALPAALALLGAVLLGTGCTVKFNRTAIDSQLHTEASSGALPSPSPIPSPTPTPSPTPSPVTQGSFNVAPVYPLHGSNWNDYVKNLGGGGTYFTRPDTACAGTELGYYACIHGGELRTFVATNQSSCAQLTAQDTLGAFNWICSAATNPVTFYSTGLALGKGLKDLVGANSWLSNSVTVSSAGTPVFQTPSSVWWGNTVGPLPVNSLSSDAPVLLSSPGQIYTLGANAMTSGYDLQGATSDRISIVTRGSAKLTYSGYATAWCTTPGGAIGAGNKAVICGGSSKFNWVEGRIDGALNAIDGIYLGDGIRFARLRNVEVMNVGAGEAALALDTNSANGSAILVDYASIHDNQGEGIEVQSTPNTPSYITILYSHAANNAGAGIGLESNVHAVRNNVLYGNVASNNGSFGITVYSDENGYSNVMNYTFNNHDGGMNIGGDIGSVMALTSAQNGGQQYNAGGGCPYFATHTNLALISAGRTAIGLNEGDCGNNFYTDIFAAYSSTGISGTSGPTYKGIIAVGQNGTDCTNSGGSTTLDASCNHGAGLAIPPITGLDPVASFVGLLTSNDPANASTQSAGTAAYPVSDWSDFSNLFRGWGIWASGLLFDAGLAGTCGTGQTCGIYDWQLKQTDTVLRNRFGAFAASAPCPASIDASNALNVIVDGNSRTFLRSAIEVMDPWNNPTGNFNGFCEDGEACIYTPNLGAYQGSGDYTQQTCTFTAGNGVTGVTMYAYPVNGI